MKRIAIVIVTTALLALGAYGQGKGNGKGRGHEGEDPGRGNGHAKAQVKQNAARNGRGGGRVVLSNYRFPGDDMRAIREYYGPRLGNLPPGLERQLIRNGTLPPGLQKKLAPFPAELDGRFAPLPAGYSRFVVGTRAVVVDVTANRVMDFFDLRR